MSRIWRAVDRLTGVLGRDCQGKPLRRGDRVEPSLPPEMVEEGAQCPGVVMGMYSPGKGQLKPRIRVKNANGIAHGPCDCWRRLDDDDRADWERVSEVTGWAPQRITLDDEVVV